MKHQAANPGFTLVELMISIALVVILMLGITKVFTLTSDTAAVATNQLSSRATAAGGRRRRFTRI